MSKRVSYVPALCVGLIAGAVTLAADYPALATDDCLASPNQQLAPGGHWYYHTDRATNRKCWYLGASGAQTPAAETPQPQPTVEATPQPTFGSFFSLMGLPPPATAPQSDTPNSAGRNGEAARSDDSRNVAAPAPRPARRPDSQAALTPKPRRPPPARPPVGRADEQPASPSDQAERDALFQEFLRWKDRKSQ
jgi:hypothetical protein